MKRFEINKQYVTVALYAFGVAAASFLFALIVFNTGAIADFFGSAVSAVKAIPYGILLALILYPFINVANAVYSRILERKKPHPRLVSTLSTLTVYLSMFLIIAILTISIIPPMIGTVGELFTKLTETLVTAEATLRNLLSGTPFLAEMADSIVDFVKTTFGDIIGLDIKDTVISLLTGFVGEAFDILVGLIISIYLLTGRRLLGSICGKLVTAFLPAGGAHRFSMFIKRLYSNFTEFIASRILSALFLGVSSFILFRIFDIPFYPLLTLIIMVLNLFPVFGTILSLLICSTVLLITRPDYTIPVIGILIALELVDNLVIEPHTMPHKSLRPNVGVVIVLLLIGYAVLGIGGALIAIPVFATVQNALRAFSVHLLNRRKLPTAIEDYHEFDVRRYMVQEEEGQKTEEEEGQDAETDETPAGDDADTNGEKK